MPPDKCPGRIILTSVTGAVIKDDIAAGTITDDD